MTEQKRPKWADWADHIRSLDDPAKNYEKPEALGDLTIIDLSSRSMAGPYCSSLLAELGAETIRIEAPGGIWYVPIHPTVSCTGVRGWLIFRKDGTSIILP